MRRALLPPILLAAFALVIGTGLASTLHAQDRSDQQRDQPAPGHETRPSDTSRGPATDEHRAPTEERRGPAEEHRPAEETHRAAVQEHHPGSDGDVSGLRRAHPHSSARCHDGFFTTTRNRSRACSKHGGIDIWLEI